MTANFALIQEALESATDSTIHEVSSWVFKYRLAVRLGDRDGAKKGERRLRRILAAVERPSSRTC